MRKVLSISMVAALCIMLASAMAFAGPNCGASKTADKTASKSECTSTKATKAEMVSAEKKTCSVSGKTVAGEMNCSPEECAAWEKMAAKHEGSEVRLMSVKGMTCGGCESSVKASLAKMDGVYEVAKVCHKGEVAVVVVDPKKVQDDALAQTVTNKGYEAQIMPAVATTSTEAGAKKASGDKPSCAKTCTKPCDKKGDAKSTSSPH